MITAPNRFIPGRPETVCIELFNVTEELVLSFNLSEFWEYSVWRELPEGAENMTVASEEVTISPEGKPKQRSVRQIVEFTSYLRLACHNKDEIN